MSDGLQDAKDAFLPPWLQADRGTGPRPIGIAATGPGEDDDERVDGVPRRIYEQLGLAAPEPVGGTESRLPALLQGAAAGLIEPATLIPSVGLYREKLRMANQDSVLGKLAYAMGYGASSLIPGAASYKLARAGLGVLRGAELLKAADTVTRITNAQRFTEGAIAGSIYVAGMDADSWQEKLTQVAISAPLAGVLDVGISAAMRAVSGTAVAGKVSERVSRAATESLAKGEIDNEFNATVIAKALSFADELYPQNQTLGAKGEDVAVKRASLLAGIERLGLGTLRSGEMRIMQSFDPRGNDVAKLLERLKDVVDSHVVPRGATTDVLVGKSGEVPGKLVGLYKRYGYLPGQVGRKDGAEFVALRAEKGRIVAHKFGDPFDGTAYKFDPGELAWTSYAVTGKPKTLALQRLVADFTEKHTLYPEAGFNKAFSEFIKGLELSEPDALELRGLLAKQQLKAIESLGGEYRQMAEQIKKGFEGQIDAKDLPRSNLYSESASQGYLARPFRGEDGKVRVNLVDLVSGEQLNLANESVARLFLQQRQRSPRDLLNVIAPDLPFSSDLIHMKPVPPPELYSQSALTDFSGADPGGRFLSGRLRGLSFILPRFMVLKRVQDTMIREGIVGPGGRTPAVFDLAESVRLGTMARANEAEPFRQRIANLWSQYKSTVRNENFPGVIAMLEAPAGDRAAVTKQFGLNGSEVKLSEDMRTFFADILKPLLKSENIDITPDKVIEHYFPHYRVRPFDGQVSSIPRPKDIESGAHTRVIKFLSEMDRMGTMSQWETNPFLVMSRYTGAAFAKMHIAKPAAELQALIRNLPSEGDWGLTKRLLSEYVVLALGGGDDMTHTLLDNFLVGLSEKLGMDLSHAGRARIVNNMLTANYGAFMGFRPALAIRNLTQVIFTTYPVLGSKYTSTGMTAALTDWSETVAEMLAKGVIKPGGVGAPIEDTLVRQRFNTVLREYAGDRIGTLEKVTELVAEFGHFSLSGEIQVGERTIPIGLYSRSDVINRAIAWKGGRAMARDAISEWVQHQDDAKLLKATRMSFFGETRTRDFLQLVKNNRREAAEDYVGRVVSDETQFIYNMGAGPAAFSSIWGRLFGQYATWPAWYLDILGNGLSRGDAADKLLFLRRSAVAHAAIVGAGMGVGINVWRWLPVTSFLWGGSPMWDFGVDVTNVLGGLNVRGEPTAAAQITLSQYGLGGGDKSAGERAYSLYKNTLGTFTPGMILVDDIYRGVQEPNEKDALLRGIGFHPAGSDWPKANFDVVRRGQAGAATSRRDITGQ